ncbi:hypothetical protein Phab24_id005 [Acinetobacter phage Phab24]|nr:hypothetical protein Phab24_id005 [Acinetobacter phage Phab24]
MPLVWISILDNAETDYVSTLQKLKYELTVDDVYDLLEYLEYKKWKNHEEMLAQQEQQNNKR